MDKNKRLESLRKERNELIVELAKRRRAADEVEAELEEVYESISELVGEIYE